LTVLVENIAGLVPYTLTLTSQFIYVFFLSATGFLALTVNYFCANKLTGLELFLPQSPLFISPLLVQIEIISYFSRMLSLPIRLFANMTAGHTLLKILSSFCLTLLFSLQIYIIVAIFLFVVIVIVSSLELMIACLQAYVFVTLFLIYIRDLEISH